jgi:uncharacterized protein DUF2804
MPDLVAHPSQPPQVAAWDHALVEPNLEDAAIEHTLAPLARVPGLGAVESAYRQRFRLKSWQYMTAVSDELFIAFVVGTAGFASNGFVYAVELPSGTVHKRFAITPFSVGTELAPTSARGTHRFETGKLAVSIANLDEGRRFAATIAAKTEGGADLAADLVFACTTKDEHLSICVPLPGGRWNYTHKFPAFSVAGNVTIGNRHVAFTPDTCFGTLDFTKMYALRHAVWRWVALCGKSDRGATIGLNLVDPTPAAPISENAVWIDGQREPLAEVALTLEPPGDARSSWRIAAQSLDAEMQAVAHVEQQLDIPLLRHRLRHVVGRFSGRVRTRSGQIHELQQLVGIAEDWDTWW